MIYNRFLACQMEPAIYETMTMELSGNGVALRFYGEHKKFAGFTSVYEESTDENLASAEAVLPQLKEGDAVTVEDILSEQHFTQPPSRYTEASLVRALEEKGIGRPSTYAPTISTIMNREYVVKEGKALRPTPLGEVVTGLMKDKFKDIVDYAFTAQMEGELDKVEEGELAWKTVIADFYGDFSEELQKAEQELDGERIKVPDEVSEELCPQCGKNLVIKSGRFGRFLACPGWPDCDFTMPLVVEMPGKCPGCGSRLFKRTGKSKETGKQYTYYCCEKRKDCTWRGIDSKGQEMIGFMTWDVPVKDHCPTCGWTMFKKAGKGARKPFCINEECANFTPEEKRGGWRKPAAKEEDGAEEKTEKKSTAKKPAAKKTTAKKETEKKSTAKKAAGEKKTATKKTTTKKSTAKKAEE